MTETQAGIEPALPERHRISRWGKAMFAGVIAGTLFTAVEMFLVEATGRGSIWDPLRLSASIALGDRVFATSTPLSFDVVFIGVLVHYALAIVYTVVLGMLIRRLTTGRAVAVGAGFGLLLYVVHFHGLSLVYPWVVEARSWIAVLGHLVYGVAAAWVYSRLHVSTLMNEKQFVLRRSAHS